VQVQDSTVRLQIQEQPPTRETRADRALEKSRSLGQFLRGTFQCGLPRHPLAILEKFAHVLWPDFTDILGGAIG
jgi:hypothetical protein